MFIARNNVYTYLGYNSGYHQFKREGDTFTLAKKAKFIDVETDTVFILSEDGKIEASFSTVKNHDKEKVDEVYNKLFTNLDNTSLFSLN